MDLIGTINCIRNIAYPSQLRDHMTFCLEMSWRVTVSWDCACCDSSFRITEQRKKRNGRQGKPGGPSQQARQHGLTEAGRPSSSDQGLGSTGRREVNLHTVSTRNSDRPR